MSTVTRRDLLAAPNYNIWEDARKNALSEGLGNRTVTTVSAPDGRVFVVETIDMSSNNHGIPSFIRELAEAMGMVQIGTRVVEVEPLNGDPKVEWDEDHGHEHLVTVSEVDGVVDIDAALDALVEYLNK